MKRAIISGFLALLFLGGLFLAQPSAEIPPSGAPPVRIPPQPIVEVRYYEGEALIHYNEVWATNKPKGNIRGTAYVWVERIPSRNLFRGRYAICERDTDGGTGICMATTYSGWVEGSEHNGVWIVKLDNVMARLGPENGFVKLDNGRMTITMKLTLKQPMSIPEPVPPMPLPVPE